MHHVFIQNTYLLLLYRFASPTMTSLDLLHLQSACLNIHNNMLSLCYKESHESFCTHWAWNVTCQGMRRSFGAYTSEASLRK